MKNFKSYFVEGLKFFLKNILMVDLALSGVVLFSFMVWPELTPDNVSDRLVWSGISIALVGGVVIFGSTVGGRNFGLSGTMTRSAHAQNLIDFNIEVRQKVESGFSMPIRLFFIGMVLFGFGALFQVFTS